MRSSAIRHPENSYFVIRRDWQIKMLDDNREWNPKRKDDHSECGAEMLSIFEFHLNNRWANRMLKTELQRTLRKTSRISHPLGDWMPYTTAYLEELLLHGRSVRVIVATLQMLSEKKFIDTNCPADITEYFTKNATWVRINVNRINAWIDENCEKTWISDWKDTRPPREIHAESDTETDIPVAEVKAQDAGALHAESAMTNAVCAFHRHIHNKNKNTVYDAKRKAKVSGRIAERRKAGFDDKQVLSQCAQVVIGNVLSEFHQGKDTEANTKAKVYDEIELMFRDAIKFENHIGYSVAKGVSEESAYREFEGFLKGIPSKYAKKDRKSDPAASNGQRDYIGELAPAVRSQYRDFARSVAGFFLSNTPMNEIIEFTTTIESINRLRKGITDAEALEQMVREAVKVFRPNGVPDSVLTQISEFSSRFCKIQRMNS